MIKKENFTERKRKDI